MIVPVPGLVQQRVAQPEVAAQVDDPVAQGFQGFQTALGHAVGEGEEEHVAALQLVHADELEARLLAQVGMHLVQELAPVALRGDLRQLHRRMLQKQPHQFAADVARAAGYGNLEAAHAEASCRMYSTILRGMSTPVVSMLLRNSMV